MSNHHQSGRSLAEAEHHIKEAVEILREETSRLRQEQESIDAMSKKLDQVHFSSTVNLNVGGQHFTTSLQTLTKDPNSMLAAMFSGKFEMKPSKDGSFFIDRDGTHFRFILNFLRTGKLTLPKGATFTEELEEEAEFYQIQGLIDALRHADNSTSFAESVILTNEEHRRVLKGWLPEGLAGEWHLLFRASRDGFKASTFHSKCDNKGPTVTIMKSGGNIFGGFTKRAWESPSKFFRNVLYVSEPLSQCSLLPLPTLGTGRREPWERGCMLLSVSEQFTCKSQRCQGLTVNFSLAVPLLPRFLKNFLRTRRTQIAAKWL